jgi:signal transduction histidine kinase
VAIKEDITQRKLAELVIQKAKSRLEVLHELDKAILESQSVETITAEALDRLENLSQPRRITLALVSEEEGWAHVYSRGLKADEVGSGMKVPAVDAFPSLKMLKAGKVVEMKRLESLKGLSESLKCLLENGIKSAVSIPIRMGKRMMGSLSMAFDIPEGFTRDDIELGKEIADTLAIALEQTRIKQNLLEHARQLEKSLTELEHINALGMSIGTSMDVNQMAQKAVDEISKSLKPDVVLFYLKEDQRLRLIASANASIHFSFMGEELHPVGECLCGHVATNGQPLYSVNINDDLRCTMNNCKNAGIKSFAGIPLFAEGKLIGVLGLGFIKQQHFADIKSFIETMAAETAMGLQNVLLLDELRKHQEELEQRVADRTNDLVMANKELESFAYSVSHDLRAPLRAISGFSDIIVESYQKSMNKDALELFGYIRESAKNMSQLILDLLKFSRLIQSKGNRQEIDLKYLLEETLRNLDKEIKEQQAKIELPADYPLLTSDRTLLGQIMQNLVQNAITYHKPDTPPLIQIQIEETDNTVVLRVQDNGIGIAEEHQQKIFDVFQRLHKQEEYPGTGIGLALVKKAVSKLDGRIWLESTPGQGTTFFVELPKE